MFKTIIYCEFIICTDITVVFSYLRWVILPQNERFFFGTQEKFGGCILTCFKKYIFTN